MAKTLVANNDFSVCNVERLLSGKKNITNSLAASIGLKCGLPRIVLLGFLAGFQAIARQNSAE